MSVTSMLHVACASFCQLSFWLALLALYLLYWSVGRWRKRNMPPGPLNLPIIGNGIQLYITPGAQLFQKFQVLGKKYGNIFTVSAGPMEMIVLNDIEAIRETLLHHSNEFAGRPKSHFLEMASDGYRDIALGDFTKVWQVQRKIAGVALRKYLSGNALEKVLHASMERVCERLRTEKGPVNPREYLYLSLYNIISGIVFSKTYELEDPDFKKGLKIQHDQFEFSSGLWADMFPFMWYLPLDENKRAKKLINDAFDLFYPQCEEHRRTFNKDHVRDLLDYLLLEQEEAAAGEDGDVVRSLSDIHINQIATDVFFAGTDTSALTLHWTLKYVAAHPEVQQRVHGEIDRIVGHGSPPTLNQRRELKFCEAVVYEAMRIRPIVPLSIPHTTTQDVKIRGYEIPKGTMVMPNIWAVHHDTNYWKHPDVFDPDNFLEEKGGSSKPESFLPFSTGRRVCLGEAIAKPEIVLLFACLMQRFRLSFPEGTKPDFTPCGGGAGLISEDYELIFTERE